MSSSLELTKVNEQGIQGPHMSVCMSSQQTVVGRRSRTAIATKPWFQQETQEGTRTGLENYEGCEPKSADNA